VTELASKNMRTALVLQLQALDVYSDDEQRHVVARWTKGRARRRTELTEEECRALTKMLRTLTKAEVQQVLNAPIPPVDPATEQLPADVIVCGASGPLDGEQRAAIADLVDDVRTEADMRPEPAAVCPEGGAATCRAEPGECCMGTPAATVPESGAADTDRGGRPAGPADAVADHRPAPPTPDEPPVPQRPPLTPEELQAAAEAAVVRFRERVAAGIVLERPAMPPMPPRRRVVLSVPPPDWSKVGGTDARRARNAELDPPAY
jgi:hypothetical protein